MITIRRSSLYLVFVVVVLTTEFFYINVAGGIARPYHFLAIIFVLFLGGTIPRLLSSRIFLMLLLFVLVNFFAAAFSSQPGAAVASLTSFLANIAVAMATAMMLLSHRISLFNLLTVIRWVTIISVAFAIVQVVAGKAGFSLGLSPEQKRQIAIGFGPAFRTEANTFGKYLTLPFMLFLPFYLRDRRDRKLRFLYLIMLSGILLSFTRSAIYGLLAGLLFVAFWHVLKGRLVLLSSRMVPITLLTALGIGIAASGMLGVSDYGVYKMENLFNSEEIIRGGSSSYRIEAMSAVVSKARSDNKYLLIGDGWGQTHAEVQGKVVQAGGGDIVNVLGASGLLGVATYLAFYLVMLKGLWRTAKCPAEPGIALVSEGVLFAAVAIFFTAQMSGYLIAPEFYLLIGMAIYLGRYRSRVRSLKRP